MFNNLFITFSYLAYAYYLSSCLPFLLQIVNGEFFSLLSFIFRLLRHLYLLILLSIIIIVIAAAIIIAIVIVIIVIIVVIVIIIIIFMFPGLQSQN